MPEVVRESGVGTQPGLQAYRFHGLDLRVSGSQAIGDCPFCGKAGKFAVIAETGVAHCWTCVIDPDSPKGGINPLSFLRRLWELCGPVTGAKDLAVLAEDRRLLDPATLAAWGIVRSPLTGDWLIPGYDDQGRIHQLYRRVRLKDKEGRWTWKLLPTPGVWEPGKAHGLHGVSLYNPKRPEVYLAEGWGDGMTLWEVLRRRPKGVTPDAHAVNVLAVPGCNAFSDSWTTIFAGKKVTLLYDNDHPRPNPKTGTLVESGGLPGMRRVAGLLRAAPTPPTDIHYLAWGEGGFDPKLPDGYDLRDHLTGRGNTKPLPPAEREAQLVNLFSRVRTAPDDWKSTPKRSDKLLPQSCEDFHKLEAAWRHALKWTPGLGYALSVSLAVACSVKLVGDQLWVKLISPPSTGKSALAEAFAVAEEYVKSLSVFKGFYSGYQSDKEGSENLSLIDKLNGKMLVIKDGDTILTLPNKAQILGQARDLYDTVGRASYNNKMSKDWSGIRFSWLLCGTKPLRSLDRSELGQRFLDCRIMDAIDDELEEEVGWRKINQVRQNLYEVNGQPESTDTPEMIRAKCLTGGYVIWLRKNVGRLIRGVTMSDEAAHQCLRWARFIAYLRARPADSGRSEEEEAGREMSTRLTSQLGKLALCLAVVLGKKTTDSEVMARVRHVTLDTAQGQTYTLIRHLYAAGSRGAEPSSLSLYTKHSDERDRKLLKFLLHELGAVERFRTAPNLPVRYRLTTKFRALYEDAVGT